MNDHKHPSDRRLALGSRKHLHDMSPRSILSRNLTVPAVFHFALYLNQDDISTSALPQLGRIFLKTHSSTDDQSLVKSNVRR